MKFKKRFLPGRYEEILPEEVRHLGKTLDWSQGAAFSLFPDSYVIWLVLFFVLSLIGTSAEKWIYHKWTQIVEGRYSYRGTLLWGWLGNFIPIPVLSISLGETPGNGSWFTLSVSFLAEGGGKGSGAIQGGTSVPDSCVMSKSYPPKFHLDSELTSVMQTWGHYFEMWWRGKKKTTGKVMFPKKCSSSSLSLSSFLKNLIQHERENIQTEFKKLREILDSEKLK